MAQPDLTVTLRAVAAWLESHPEADVQRAHFDSTTGSALHCYSVRDSADLAARARAIGGHWTKQADDVGLFRLRQEIVPGVFYELIADREDVCERVEVGEKIVFETDPDAPTVKRRVPVYEWRCDPILEGKQ